MLIDEAQDLPPEFFQLVYLFTSEPKRIVWGYDELQKLSEAAMPSTSELFGRTATGQDRVNITNVEGAARRDILLPVCYRNTPWALATAHAVGFGVYRNGKMVQHFDEPSMWQGIGYEVVRGSLEASAEVTLRRASSSYPPYFDELLTKDDAVVSEAFASELEQDVWVATQIRKNLSEDELEPDDILIVLPDAYTSKKRSNRLTRVLAENGIRSHLVGVASSVEEVFVPGSVAIAHIFRAKGNEAPMVYALDAQYAARGTNTIQRRNILFTAITRSRAWVRITGWGDDMAVIKEELAAVRDRDFQLEFVVPTAEEIAQMRREHKDRSQAELQSLKKATTNLKSLLSVVEEDRLDLSELPEELRHRLRRLLDASDEDNA